MSNENMFGESRCLKAKDAGGRRILGGSLYEGRKGASRRALENFRRQMRAKADEALRADN
jgi:hypothetical protein